MTTPLPHSPDAEQSVLGAVLINPDVYYDVAYFLTAGDFYIHRNAFIWQAIGRLNEKSHPVDIVTVTDELERMGKLGEVTPSYLTQLVTGVYDSFNAERYARIVEADSIRRRMIAAATGIAQTAYNPEIDVNNALEHSHGLLQGITPGTRENQMDLADRVLEQVEIARDKMGEITGIPTGLRSLNAITDGWKESDLVFIAARPGMGKTGLLLTHARAALRAGKKAVFFSMEMGDVSVAQRLIAQEKNIDLFNLRRGRMTDDEYSRFVDGLEWLRSLHLEIDETPGLTPAQVHAKAKQLYHRGKCDIIFVDYVQLMNGRGDNRTQEVGYCSRGLKQVAKDLHVPVISAAQLSREIERRGNQRPTLADLRESGDLEADADVIIFIWQKGEKVERAEIDPAFITIGKHRNGPVGDLVKGDAPLVQFVRKSTKFEDA